MAASKYKASLKKKLLSEHNMFVSSLRKENVYLKKSLAELSRQHSQHNKLVERFLSLESKRLQSCQHLTAKDEKTALLLEQLYIKEGNPTEKSTRWQQLFDLTSDEQAFTNDVDVAELQNNLRDALEKNRLWLEYDQEREAYVRAILGRMLWLENQLNEANQAHSQQHNEAHSDEKEKIFQIQEHYEQLLQKAKDELEVLREQTNIAQQNLIMTENWYKEREMEVEELRQQLSTERMSRNSARDDQHCPGVQEQQQSDEAKDLHGMLVEEKRRSANFELQANMFQRFMLNRHHTDQEEIADLKRQIRISSQDLEDERHDCSYLKKQMIRVLKKLQKTKDHSEQQDPSSCEGMHPPSQFSREISTSSPRSSVLNESFLECPSCQAKYPANDYRKLINHLETCLD
ncbi:centrosomal protein of 55 kDa-like isoform X2 [Mugil cephalus]|uniref:centrosomal protein of 55 kDa-like isoform X2 n=1 Tax=Mugil cephalus TaxID=48193 RepID=UPI001FB5E781|nr:centrosomal protein of 55 kDa-like isoform X2 [Mugil cephalus]